LAAELELLRVWKKGHWISQRVDGVIRLENAAKRPCQHWGKRHKSYHLWWTYLEIHHHYLEKCTINTQWSDKSPTWDKSQWNIV
jgi:hypothetical protein